MIVSSWYSNFVVSENGILAHGASIGYSSPLTLSDQVSNIKQLSSCLSSGWLNEGGSQKVTAPVSTSQHI